MHDKKELTLRHVFWFCPLASIGFSPFRMNESSAHISFLCCHETDTWRAARNLDDDLGWVNEIPLLKSNLTTCN